MCWKKITPWKESSGPPGRGWEILSICITGADCSIHFPINPSSKVFVLLQNMKNGEKNKRTLGSDKDSFLDLFRWLDRSGALYIIVGGVAANLHGLARSTKDIDLLIPKNFENTEKILEAVSHAAWGIAKEILPEDVLKRPFTIIGDMPRVDLLLRAGKLTFEDAYADHDERLIEGIRFPYASLDALILSKQTNRPRDLLEIEDLKIIKKSKNKK